MIALIGAHGVGKTTILQDLIKAYPSFIVADGSSRLVRGFNDEIKGKLSPKDEQLLINRISDDQWPNEIRVPNRCQTRTPLDHYAYCEALGMYEYAQERLELFKKSDYKKVQFFYVPIEFEIEDDGIRYLDNAFQQEIDSILRRLIKELDISVITLNGGRKARLKTLVNNIKF